MADELLHVRINTPEKLLWEGDARSVSSKNVDGPFDILPMHANFITIVENEKIFVRTASETKDFSFPHSVIYAHANAVNIYTNI